MFYFCHSKNPSTVTENIFNSIYIQFCKNTRGKCIIRKINLFFFDVMKNGKIFLADVCHFQYDHRIFFSREMGSIRMCMVVRLQKLVKFKFSGQYSCCHFSSCLKKKNHLERVSPSHFLQSVLIETSNVLLNLLSYTSSFLNFMKFRIFKTH